MLRSKLQFTLNEIKPETGTSNPRGSDRSSRFSGFFGDSTMKRIPLTQGRFAIVDDEDYEELSKYKWYAFKDHGIFYAVRGVGKRLNRKTIRMHREILGAVKGQEVDHRNGDGLYNCRVNLRFCTHTENLHNQKPQIGGSSRFKGVYWYKNKKKWVATIGINGYRKHLGCFDNEMEAAKAYNCEAKELFGEFARLNNC